MEYDLIKLYISFREKSFELSSHLVTYISTGVTLSENDFSELPFHLATSNALFARLISHQPAVLFSHNKPATSNQPAVLFSQNKSAPVISHQPTEQAVKLLGRISRKRIRVNKIRKQTPKGICNEIVIHSVGLSATKQK
jgi:hypothetical protein